MLPNFSLLFLSIFSLAFKGALQILDKLLTHQKDEKIKKTNNIAENINRRLMIRLKTIESFKNFNSAKNYLNLYKNYLRFKPYTDCKGNNKNKNEKITLRSLWSSTKK